MDTTSSRRSRGEEARAAEKNPHALLEQLMQEYATELKRIAYLYVNDPAECEDIIQEVFISCYQNLSGFRHEASYKTWLIRMTINKCKDHHRLWSVKNLVYKPVVQFLKIERSAEEQLIDEEDSKAMVEKISKLSGKYKEVLILYYYLEMTMQEISEVLGININTVKSRLLRGKKALLSKFERSIDHG